MNRLRMTRGLVISGFVAVGGFRNASDRAVMAPTFGPPPFHVHLEKSQPAANDTVNIAPKAITLWFSEPPELAVTLVKVSGADNKALQMDAPKRGTKAMGAGGEAAVVVGIKEAPKPGTYSVVWKTTSDDGHPAEGKFTFVIRSRPDPEP